MAISAFVVVLFLTPTSNVGAPSRSPLAAAAGASTVNSTSPPYLPYLASPSSYPTPDEFPNVTGNVSLPQIGTITLGTTFYYVLVFVDQLPQLGYVLDFDTGAYDPSSAQAIATKGCAVSCTDHLPIHWNGVTPIAAYGGAPIQYLSLVVNGTGTSSLLIVGVSSNNTTMVYVSSEAGAPGSWGSLTGQSPILGADPRIDYAVEGCGVTVVTTAVNATFVWMTLRCNTQIEGGPNHGIGPSGDRPRESAGALLPASTLPPAGEPNGPAVISAVLPQVAPNGSWVTVLGSGFESVSSVRVGSEATAFQRTNAATLEVWVPPGKGSANIQALQGSTWSAATCSDRIARGNAEIPGTPQVLSVSPNATATGPVFIEATNLDNFSSLWFGSQQVPSSSITFVNATTLEVTTLPSGTGAVNVTIEGVADYESVTSPVTCADLFQYGSFFLFSVSPSAGTPPLTVTLGGTGFESNATVYFGTKKATSTTFVSPTELLAGVPKISGSVEVSVREGPATSDDVRFRYVANPLSVSAVLPGQGPAGTEVTIDGTGFNQSAAAHFGPKVSGNTTYLSPTEIEAGAPGGKGTVAVVVDQKSLASPTSCRDRYTYGKAYAAGLPEITSLSSAEGVGGSNLTIYGTGFAGTDTVLFGGVPALSVNPALSNASALNVVVPLGLGNVSVQVEGPAGTSPITCNGLFDLAAPGNLTNPLGFTVVGQVALPPSTSAVPIWLPQPHPFYDYVAGGIFGGLGVAQYGEYVFAVSDGILSEYSVTFSGYQPFPYWWDDNEISAIGTNVSSPVFDAVGDTALSIPGGSAGQIAAARDGSGVMLLVTADVNGRTDLETLVAPGVTIAPGGFDDPSFNFSAYFTTPVAGSASDPQLVAAPYGDYYATWLENGAGPEQIDEAIYTASGNLLQAPEVVTGSGGGAADNNSAGNVSLTVDPSGRPVLVWDWTHGPATGTIDYTGAYLPAAAQLGALESAWASLTKPDFLDFGARASLASLEARASSGIANVSRDLGKGNLCGAQQNASNVVYTNDTWISPAPAIWGPAPKPTCVVYVGRYHNTVLANASGVLSANFFLSVETQWLLEALGVGEMPIPDWASVAAPPTSNYLPFLPDTDGLAHNSRLDSVLVAPNTTTENSLWLHAVGVFQPESSRTTLYSRTLVACGSIVEDDSPTLYREYAAIRDQDGGAAGGSFTSTVGVPSPVFTHLYAADNGTWNATFRVTFTTVKTVTNDGCGSGDPSNGTTVVKPPAGWPTVEEFNVSGNFTTGLDPAPYELQLHGVTNTTSKGGRDYSLGWENTVNATAWLFLNGTCGIAGECNETWSNSTPLEYESASGGNLSGVPYQLGSLAFGIRATDYSADTVNWPQIDANEVSEPSPTEYYNASCAFAKQPAADIWWTASKDVTNLTSGSATFTWYSNQSATNTTGWVELQLGNATPANVSGQNFAQKNGTTKYVAEATGLESWQVYSVRFFVDVLSGCVGAGATLAELTNQYSVPAGSIQVPGRPLMYEEDRPYDSVTQQGGGAILAWQIPVAFEDQGNTTFENGSLTLTPENDPSGATVVVPIEPPLYPFTNYSEFDVNLENGTATTYAINVSGLALNTEYSAELVLNYSTPVAPHFEASNSTTFWYEKDTSGDGLTDWEKQYGWYVTSTDAAGATSVEHVTANVDEYATNGLVGDFIEKEYGLNPTTVDSAGSHLLDTWNLTFDLSQGGGAIPSGANFEVWNESGTYDPFAPSVQFTPGLFESGVPLGDPTTYSNLTPSAAGGIRSGDGDPWAAEVLWSYSALQHFVDLAGVENSDALRAVLGTWNGQSTLTVVGKLSWGADPLTASTPGDGIADGERVSAIGTEGLTINITNLYVEGLSTGQGYAAEFTLYPGSSASGSPEFTNFSAPVGLDGGVARLVDYQVTVPVNQTDRYETLQIEVLANESGTSTLTPIAFADGATVADLTYDMVAGTSVTEDYLTTQSQSDPNGSLDLTVQAVPTGGKSPTYLWLPTDNGTTNGLPLGLERYTGQEAFDLVLVNASTALTSSAVPFPDGGSYSVSLSPGLNNLLFPEEGFLASPFGQAVLAGSAVAPASNTTTPPILSESTAAQNLLTRAFGKSAGLLYELGAYWQNRSIAPGTGGGTFSSVDQVGTAGTSAQQVAVAEADFASGSNVGTLPADANLYPGYLDLPALSGIVTVNITSTATLDLLLAGLFDNSTGGVNGSFQKVTAEVPSLGLETIVTGALANAPVIGEGLYGAPPNNQPPPPPPHKNNGIWGAFVNAVTAVVETVSGAIESLVAVVWTATVAAFTYIDHLAREAAAIGGALVSRAADALISVGEVLEEALQQLLEYIVQELEAALAAAFGPIIAAALAYTRAIADDFEAAVNASSNGQSIAAAAAQFWSDVAAPLFYVAIAAAVAIEIVVTLVEGLSLGTAFLLSLVVGALVTAAIGASVLAGGRNLVSDLVGLSPLSPSLADELDNLTSSYDGGPRSDAASPAAGSDLDAEDFDVLGQLMGIGTTSVAGSVVLSAWENKVSAPWSDTVSVGLGLVGMITCAAAASLSSLFGSILSCLFDVDSLLIDAFGPDDGLPALVTALVDLGDIGTAAVDFGELVTGH